MKIKLLGSFAVCISSSTTMRFSYLTPCDLCTRCFKSLSTLKRHKITRHSRVNTRNVPNFYDESGKGPTESFPKPKKLPKGQMARYKEWLSMVVERFSGTHHPKFEGNFQAFTKLSERFCLTICYIVRCRLQVKKTFRTARKPFLAFRQS